MVNVTNRMRTVLLEMKEILDEDIEKRYPLGNSYISAVEANAERDSFRRSKWDKLKEQIHAVMAEMKD